MVSFDYPSAISDPKDVDDSDIAVTLVSYQGKLPVY